MIRYVKFALGSGVVLMALGLFGLAFTMTGCSGESTVKVEDAKIQGMSPGEYLDSHDAKPVKGAKGKARPRR